MAKRHDLCFQRRTRPKQSDERIPNQSAKINHRAKLHPIRCCSLVALSFRQGQEWEYAARAGTKTARWWGEAIGRNRANCNGCGSPWDDRLLATVESFAPNPFGLYGLLGNAWQWTEDCWHPNYIHAPDDGRAWTEKNCEKHVIRGGSWNNLPVLVRSASRSFGTSDGGDYDNSSLTGFRVARDLP